MYNHTEICELTNGGSFCNCQPISVQLASEGSWVPTNGLDIPRAKLDEPRQRYSLDGLRVSVRHYSRCGENL